MRRRTPPDLARLAAARGALRRRQLRAYQPPAQRRAPAVSGSQASGRARVPVGVLGAPRTAAAGGSPRQPRGTLEGAQRAVHRRRLRPTTPRRCGSSGAALVARRRSPARWSSHTRSTTTCKGPRARGVVQTPEPHSGRAWGPHLPGQPASRLHPHALVRAAFDNVGSDRHGLWVRHADTHAQSNTPGARGLTVRRSPSIGRAEARHGRDSRATRALSVAESTARGGRFDRSRRSIRPVHRASRPAGSGESESFKGRLDSTRSVEWADGRSTRSPDSTLPLWRVALSRGRLAAASGPPPRASRPLATTCAAATSSAGPS